LSVCACCGGGIKFSRGWTWIEPFKLLEGDHGNTTMVNNEPAITVGCGCASFCPVCYPSIHFLTIGENFSSEPIKAGLMWVGEKHYSTESFSKEANDLGISKRISAIPRGFKVGETWIFLAHKKAVENNGSVIDDPDAPKYTPAIFTAFRPQRIERIVLESEKKFYDAVMHDLRFTTRDEWNEIFENEYSPEQTEILKRLRKDVDRGITLVPVPDDDPDHNPGKGGKS
jgi:hypothetical protein